MSTLNELMVAVADSIRAKEGSTEKIAPVDFPQRINDLQVGGGGEIINNQDKVVNITENGTTEVVADDGYTGLGKVTVYTQVSSGGTSPSLPSDADVFEPNDWYWKINDDALKNFQIVAHTLMLLQQEFGFKIFESINESSKRANLYETYYAIGSMMYCGNDSPVSIRAFRESKWLNGEKMGLEGSFNSFYDLLKELPTDNSSVEAFEEMMRTEMGLTRITEEEYLALLSEE